MPLAIEQYHIDLQLNPVESSPFQKLYGGEIEVEALLHVVNDGPDPTKQLDLCLSSALGVER